MRREAKTWQSTVKGLDDDTEGSYFISKVRHRFTGSGYFTQFEVKGAKA